MLAITNNIKFKSGTEALFLGILSIISALLLILIGTFIISSTFVLSSVHAESGNSEASLDIASVLDISAPSTTTLNCTPGSTSASAQLCTSSANVSVTTNNLTGYTLYMNATNGSPTALTNSSTSPSSTIPTITQAYSSANLPVNTWGYTGGTDKSSESGGYNCASNYCPILAYDSGGSYAPNHTIKITDAPATTSTTNITFGGKVDISKPSGTYSTSVTFTAVANAMPEPPIAMQDATLADCGKIMYDNRGSDDYKDIEYTTAEINGLCWMTRNLDLPGGTKLSHADTNVPEGYSTTTAGFTNGDTLPASSTSGFSSSTTAYVYNSNSTTCGNNSPCYSYYSWRAATAGYNSTSSSTPVNYDICPSGWRLPTSAELTTLKNSYSTGTALTGSPFLGVYAGVYYNSQFYDGGSYGYYWSSTANNSNNAYYLYFNSSSADVRNDYKNKGYSVRCVFKS